MNLHDKRRSELVAHLADVEVNIDATKKHIAQLQAEIARHQRRLTDLEIERDVQRYFWAAAQAR